MTTAAEGEHLLRVQQIRWEAEGVVSVRLVRPDGGTLPPWEPGAHLEIRLPSGLVRPYSLCGRPDDRTGYTVSVLRAPDGRGGSAEIHDTGLVGRALTVRGPRNQFRLQPAPAHVLVAGGIGITPIVSMARELATRGTPWTVHYGGRSARSMAFAEEIAGIADACGALADIRPEDLNGILPLQRIVDEAPQGAAVYACGPSGMLAALRDAVDARPDVSLHTELFAAPAPAADGVGGQAPARHGRDITIVLAQTGETVTVTDGTTILEAVRRLRPEVPYSCEEGFCGTCITKVLGGSPVHRDTVLSDEERAANVSMVICVGSCDTDELVLDL